MKMTVLSRSPKMKCECCLNCTDFIVVCYNNNNIHQPAMIYQATMCCFQGTVVKVNCRLEYMHALHLLLTFVGVIRIRLPIFFHSLHFFSFLPLHPHNLLHEIHLMLFIAFLRLPNGWHV